MCLKLKKNHFIALLLILLISFTLLLSLFSKHLVIYESENAMIEIKTFLEIYTFWIFCCI